MAKVTIVMAIVAIAAEAVGSVGCGLAEIAAFNQPSQAEATRVRNDQQHDGMPP